MSLIIYEHIDFNGAHQHIYTTQFSLFTFNHRISSIQVLDGEYEFYDQASFTGNKITLPKGIYPNLVNLGWNDRILSIKRISGKNVGTKGMILYENKDFKGRHKHIIQNTLRLGDDGWNDKVSSIQIVSGRWEIFADQGFTGKSVILDPGIYPDASAIGLSDNSMSSIRLLDAMENGPFMDEMIAFDAHAFSGEHLHLVSTGIRNLADYEWNNRILSLIVLRGADWMLFRDKDWKGPNVILPPGAFGTYTTGAHKKLLFPLKQVTSIRNIPVNTAIETKYHDLGARESFLGEPLQPEDVSGDGYGFFRHFRNGSIYWHPEVGAFEVHGLIRDKWKMLGAETGSLGYPVSDELASHDGISRVSHFQHGSVYYTHQNGKTTVISGRCWQKWADLGFEDGPLGHPLLDQVTTQDSTVIRFRHGMISRGAQSLTPVTFYAQNMALLVWPGGYPPDLMDEPEEILGSTMGGAANPIHAIETLKRGLAIDALVNFLRTSRFDFVGLSEVFADDERKSIRNRLSDIYVASMSGPDEHDVESDGGLLLLSRHPVTLRNSTIYRQYSGDDGFANKGVLHARASVPGHTRPYDIFLTHMQNPDEEKGREIVNDQAFHMNSFILSVRDPDNPAVLMGDINTDMEDLLLAREFRKILRQPEDVWKTAGDGTPGFTLDPVNTVKLGSNRLPVTSPLRHQEGERVDAILSWKGRNHWPVYTGARVVVLQRENGHDISDHYGVTVSLGNFDVIETVINTSMAQVTVKLVRFHCLETTEGGGDDEVKFFLKIKPANGPESAEKATAQIKGISNGTLHDFPNPLTHSVNDPGNNITIMVRGKEIDDIIDDDMGRSTLVMSRQELLEAAGRTVVRAMPRLRDGGGTYVPFVSISVMKIVFGNG